MTGYARLVVTDGDAIIDLLHPQKSFATNAWREQTALYKGGGVWQQSALSDGRRLVVARYDNITQSFPICLSAARQDIAIRALQDLLRLLVKAAAYSTTDWQDEPVWIESRALFESNTRYTIIETGHVPDLNEIYGTAFSDNATLPDLTLQVEHGHWTSYSPGTATAVAISASETFDGRNLGNVDSTGTEIATTSEEVYIVNKRNTANITDIYIDDGGVWGANLMDAAIPFNLLPAVPAVGDAVYFGIDTTLTNSGPFNNLVFDLSAAQVGCTIVWEIWTGAAWVTFEIQDNTNANGDFPISDPFDTAGVRSVHFLPPTAWATRDISIDGGPAITGYFVRARVTAIAAPTPPTQQNRKVYSIVWPYVNIGSDQIRGDISAIARTLLRNRSGASDGIFVEQGYGSRVVAGLRSYERGSNFTAYINLADEQNPTGITIANDVNSAFATNTRAPSGRCIVYTPIGVEASASRAQITFTNAIVNQFLGEFHVYLRVERTGGTSTTFDVSIQARLGDSAGTAIFESESVGVSTTTEFHTLDFGVMTISPKGLSQIDEFEGMYMTIRSGATGAGPTLTFFDLILIPTDEWVTIIQRAETAGGTITQFRREQSPPTRTRMLDAGSVLKPKEYITALLKRGDDGRTLITYQTITNNLFILQANKRQRLWFLVMRRNTSNASPVISHAVREYKNERYLGPRGNR
jgi:hypothetical protein